MTVEIYLWINAVLYAAFAIWCLLQPTATATFSGLSFLNNSGRSEYFALYVGLEAAWSVMYVICAVNPELHYAGIFYSVFLYAGVIAGRWISIFQKGISSNNTYVIAILELILGAWAVWILAGY
jgi:hypothetical protein